MRISRHFPPKTSLQCLEELFSWSNFASNFFTFTSIVTLTVFSSAALRSTETTHTSAIFIGLVTSHLSFKMLGKRWKQQPLAIPTGNRLFRAKKIFDWHFLKRCTRWILSDEERSRLKIFFVGRQACCRIFKLGTDHWWLCRDLVAQLRVLVCHHAGYRPSWISLRKLSSLTCCNS